MYFKNINKVEYKGKESMDMFSFKHYNPTEVINGKTMKENMRFAIAYWHTMTQDGSDPFGEAVNQRLWLDNSEMQTSKNRVDAFFELLVKLDAPYFCFHDKDIAPEGSTLQEYFNNLDEITDLIKNKIEETGIELLWNTSNAFTNKKFLNGAASNPDANVFAHYAAQVKKSLDISKKLGGTNVVFWGGREGYETLLNTDISLEQENIARLLWMAVEYAEKIDHKVQFLIEPKPLEPMKHQYDYDAATTMSFLIKHGLDKHFKLNLEANHATLAGHTFEHEIAVARSFGALGSLDANQGDYLLGWDTDEFPTSLYETTLAMYELVENDGIAPGGINFDSKVRRSSFSMDDLVIAHIAGMDTYARAYKSAVRIKESGFLDNIKKERYISYETGLGKEIIDNKTNLEYLTQFALENDEITFSSSHIEFVKSKLNDFIF